MIFVTTPAPTVRPPSRTAKRRPSSLAIGWISSISMVVLSPVITISWPSGSLIEPVTRVVREDVLDRHQERLVDIARRLRDVRVDVLHQLEDLRRPLLVALERLQRRDLDDRDLVAGELVLRE